MNEIREVAKAYYNGAEEKEKRIAQLFFEKLDENGDGKVSLESFKRKADPSFPCTEHNFRALDDNGDGTLDFDEVLALYYMTKVPITSCSVCSCMLLDSYFSCLRCLGKASYSLCCHCYGRGKFGHHHPSDDFADTRAQLTLLEQLLGQEQVPRNRRDIFNQEEAKDDNAKRRSTSSSAQNPTAKSHANVGEAFREVLELGHDVIDLQELLKQVVDMMNNEEAPKEEVDKEEAPKEGIDTNEAVEAPGEGIDTNEALNEAPDEGIDMNDGVDALDQGFNNVNDAVDALDQGIDILDAVDAVVEVASAVASCSIM